MEVNEDWQIDKPNTYKFAAETKISNAAEAVKKAFDEKGRLLIVGSPGSGKTVLLLKLALELLGNYCKAEQKLPVIFNIASWSEIYENFEDWLIELLNSGNGLSKDFAKKLLQEKRIIFLLDGLDELARNENTENANQTRRKCLESLNNYLREGREVVIFSRREELVKLRKATNQDTPVSAKIEVLDLNKNDIISALQHALSHNESRASAENLLKIINTNDVFLDILSTPFYFTTALEVFDKQLLNEKDFPTKEEAIKKYLIGKFIESKFQHTRNLIRFEKDEAKIMKWLKWLAKLMEKKQLITFELADLQPTDLVSRYKYSICYCFCVILLSTTYLLLLNYQEAFSLSIEVPFYVLIIDALSHSIFVALPVILVYLYFSLKIVTSERKTFSVSLLSDSKTYYGSLKKSLIYTTVLIISAILWRIDRTDFSAISYKSAINFSIFYLYILLGFLLLSIFNSCRVTVSYLPINKPYQRLMAGFFSSILLGIILPAYIFSSLILIDYLETGRFTLWENLLYVFIGIGFIIGFCISVILKHFILRFCLWFENSAPLKYATFLNYAAEARILEKDGGFWRFRHQILQEHFANSNRYEN